MLLLPREPEHFRYDSARSPRGDTGIAFGEIDPVRASFHFYFEAKMVFSGQRESLPDIPESDFLGGFRDSEGVGMLLVVPVGRDVVADIRAHGKLT